MKGLFKKFICGAVLSVSAALCSNYSATPYMLPDNVLEAYLKMSYAYGAFVNMDDYPWRCKSLYESIASLPTDHEKICAFFCISKRVSSIEINEKALNCVEAACVNFQAGKYHNPKIENSESQNCLNDTITLYIKLRQYPSPIKYEFRRPISLRYLCDLQNQAT